MDDIKYNSVKTAIQGEFAKVAKLDGAGFVRHADGSMTPLKAGMALKLGDVVVTNPGAHASIELAEGATVPCGNENGDVLAIDKTVLDFFEDAQDVKVTDAKNFDDALKDLADPNNPNPNDLNNLEATAAGTSDYAFGANGVGFLQFGNFNYHDPYSGLVTRVGQGGSNYYNTLALDTRRDATIDVKLNPSIATTPAYLK
jgi:hypothetical protein